MLSPNDLIGMAFYMLFGAQFAMTAALIAAFLVVYIIITTAIDAFSGKTTSPKPEGGK